MPTLLLRLAAPLQSWGSSSKFETRTTEKMPTKSGVIGLLAAALGYRRDADLTELSALKFGVRADREGEDITDFQMAHQEEYYRNFDSKYSHLTIRHYLTDAAFLAGFEGDEKLLAKLEHALQNPVFPLFLGRRSCPPTLPLVIGIREESLESALRNEPPICRNNARKVRIRIETDGAEGGMIQDEPVSFNPSGRIHGYRRVREFFIEPNQSETEHDAMSELEG